MQNSAQRQEAGAVLVIVSLCLTAEQRELAVVVVLSDGQPTDDRRRWYDQPLPGMLCDNPDGASVEVANAVRRLQVPLHSIGIDNLSDRFDFRNLDRELMQALAGLNLAAFPCIRMEDIQSDPTGMLGSYHDSTESGDLIQRVPQIVNSAAFLSNLPRRLPYDPSE